MVVLELMKNNKFSIVKFIIILFILSHSIVSFSALALSPASDGYCETDDRTACGNDCEKVYPTITSAYAAGCNHCKPLFEFESFNLLCSHANADNKLYWVRLLVDDVICDYSLYYGLDNLPYFFGVVGASALMANTGFDHGVRNHIQHKFKHQHYHTQHSNRWTRNIDKISAFSFMKVYIGGIFIGYWFKDDWGGDILYRWANRSLRAFIIASPQVTLLRKVLGSGRPNGKVGRDYTRSKWRLGKNERSSVSGHTFNGAIPFITAGLMTDNLALRYGLYAISTIPGLSRMHGRWHYFSQVFLGWSLSYLAARIVDIADQEKYPQVQVNLCPVRDGAMLYGKYDF